MRVNWPWVIFAGIGLVMAAVSAVQGAILFPVVVVASLVGWWLYWRAQAKRAAGGK